MTVITKMTVMKHQKYHWRNNRLIIMDTLENQAIGLILRGIEVNTKRDQDTTEDYNRKMVLYHYVDEIGNAKHRQDFRRFCNSLMRLMDRYKQAMIEHKAATSEEIAEYESIERKIRTLCKNAEISRQRVYDVWPKES